MIFDSISSNIDEVLTISPSAIVFVFGDFNVHHREWLTYSSDTDRPGELCYDFLSQMTLVRWLTFLLWSLTVTLTVASICSAMAFVPLANSDHVVVSVSIDFPTNSKRDAPFHRIAYDYSRADLNGLRDHSRDVPWKDTIKLSGSAAASEFCERVFVGIDVYISDRKYQIKPH